MENEAQMVILPVQSGSNEVILEVGEEVFKVFDFFDRGPLSNPQSAIFDSSPSQSVKWLRALFI